MKYLQLLLILLLLVPILAKPQKVVTVSGVVLDELKLPLPGCHVHFGEVCVITNTQGQFFIDKVHPGKRKLTFSFMGYLPLDTLVEIIAEQNLQIILHPEVHRLNEISIQVQRFDTAHSIKNEIVDSRFVAENLTGTFIKSLEKISGINVMSIGANASKPFIRGMGFNRVVVSENGIKQENQQWGADHGVEVDPFSIETAELIKGASPIEYGSDALGGVINLDNQSLPFNGPVAGEASMLIKSINNTFGGSVQLQQRKNKIYYKARASYLSFGDYAIPTDTIVYLTRKIPIHNRNLKNTAGNEFDWSGQLGYISTHFKSVLSVSNVSQKSGFFPGAHGIPDETKVADDGNLRNVEFPFQQVRHTKVSSNNKWFLHEFTLFADLGFQQNHRQEWSLFHSHFPGQIPPDDNPDLELDFRLNTFSGNFKAVFNTLERNELTIGLQNQHSNNRVDGYSYFLPGYKRLISGFFIKDELSLNAYWKFFGGLRFDYGIYQGTAYFDSLVYQYVKNLPDRSAEDAAYYAQRSQSVAVSYPGISWHLGSTFQGFSNTLLRVNLGKAFRVPTAVELGANGVHHGSYRFEVGNPALKNETGYYFDFHGEYKKTSWNLGIGAYAYYFDNFIYLQPTGTLDHPLPDAGGVYYYRQSQALISGLELVTSKTFYEKIILDANLELPYNYLINEQGLLSYGIPFTPPVNGYLAFKILLGNRVSVAANSKWAWDKDKTRGQGELATPGYMYFGLVLMADLNVKKLPLSLVFQVQNLFDKKYYNHMSFYRKLNIPEQGRNIQLVAKLKF
ncbi:MAG: TonB-dependent receptor [Salinivirgaceae bacterium]